MNAKDLYNDKLRSAEEAASLIPDGSFVIFGNAIGEPPALLSAVADRAKGADLTHLRMSALLPLAAAQKSILQPECADVIQWESLFVSAFDRDRIADGSALFTPAYFHQVPRLYREFMPIDVTMVCLSPMDRHGYMSLGTSVDASRAAIEKAQIVLAEINPQLPRVHGDSWVHISEVDAIVENDTPLFELPVPPERPEDAAMGATISEMIPNGATLQLGIGGVPNAVAKSLFGHRNLGIHTEMFVDSMVDLIESGVADGSRKTFHPLKALYAFAAGSRRMYDFLDDNPHIEAHPVSYVNLPSNIARNNELISVNSTLEIDLTGQCGSESIGPLQYSGTGGQHDYARGAFDSPGGKSIMAFYSTARSGEVSRVVSTLKPGTIVTTPRNEVHWAVSEYGAVNLKGLSTRERAKGLIGLAHPQFRDQLSHDAHRLGYL
ncbi:MAG: acetyl-CoA hydrolase/transferase C-terminal domain-containing protein [Myxococcota bacterium]|nr:acetyl-CoA hydrolase/transferase C-terminal domain-containing protein [Myxococcota bacterium]